MSHKKHILKATTYDKRGRVIATAMNSFDKSHPIQSKFAKQANLSEKIYLHAEISCIIKSRHRDIHKIKIERYSNDGSPLLAAPCPICQLAIKEAGIKFVEYTVG